jgi:uncharacterized SAM-binding protein YcdF (DUF218 family)
MTEDIQIVNGFPMPTRQARKKIVVSVLGFCFALIAYIVVYGSADNSLQSSALSWAFSLSGATVGAYVFGSTWDNSNVIASYKSTVDSIVILQKDGKV